jgi:lipid-binding SYLF domain-containing protein
VYTDNKALTRLLACLRIVLFAWLLFACAGHVAQASDAEKIIVNAELVIKEIIKNENDYGRIREMLKRCAGVLIVPQYLKAGLVWGGAGGSGVLLSRDENNNWSAPAFYDLGAASIGLQIGVSSSEVVMVIMNERGVRAIISNEVKLGADLSVAAGPIGGRGETATTGNLVADIYSYARSRGLFAGISLEGGLIKPAAEENTEVYGKDVKVEDLVIQRTAGADKAKELRNTLKRASANNK